MVQKEAHVVLGAGLRLRLRAARAQAVAAAGRPVLLSVKG